jgi:hypothetical protein
MTSRSSVHEAHSDVSMVVGLANIPETIRSLDTLDNPDYVDLYTATTVAAKKRSPEQWARAAFEESPAAHRRSSLAWGMLRLRLGPSHSPDYVHGWKIAERGEDWIRMETASWYMTTHIVFQVDERHVNFALFVRYDRPVAVLIWPLFSIAHRQASLVLMRRVARSRTRTV